MNLTNRLNSIQMIDTGIYADLVHHNDTSLLCFALQLAHRRRDIARSHYVRLPLDGSHDDIGMVHERD